MTIQINVAVGIHPPNNNTLLHQAILTISGIGSTLQPCGKFRAYEILSKLNQMDLPEAEVEMLGCELLRSGRAVLTSAKISEADLRRAGLLEDVHTA